MGTLATILTVLFQGGIVVVFLLALRQSNGAAVVNALVALAASLLPATVEVLARLLGGVEITFGAGLSLWLAVAGCLHAYGMLGPYDSVQWWDHVTHTVSAALVAALAYAGLLVAARHGGPLLGVGAPVLAVGVTLLAGVFWELLELAARRVGERFGVDPVLVHYGWRDTALDLGFDAVGALLVVALDVRLFVPLAEQVPGTTVVLVRASTGALLGGSVVLALALVLARATDGRLA